MLERATACIKAGARDSLKCAQQPPRISSRRRLHRTFWTHGAGDLDLDLLPQYAISSTPTTVPLARHGDSRLARRKDHTTAPLSNTTEGIFLDFLYTPQALAFLHRTGRQQFERRSAGRLPEGIVQTSRGFSSKPRSRADFSVNESLPRTGGVARSGEEEHESPVSNNILSDDEDESGRNARLREGQYPGHEVGLAHTLAKELGVGRATETGMDQSNAEAQLEEEGEGEEEEEEAVAPFANSVGDLAEENIASTALDGTADNVHDPRERLRQLRQIMALKSNAITISHIRQAWRWYLSLPDDDKQDARLKEKLLVWLNDRDNELADAYIISLYWSISVDARTLATYQTVAESFTRRQELAMLHAMHKEALLNIPNGQQVTLQLFTNGLRNGDWGMMQQVVLDHDSTFPADGRHQRIELFWAKVQCIPDLTNLAWSIKQRGGNMPHSRHLRVRLSKEAVQQATDMLFVTPFPDDFRGKVFRLLRLIKDADEDVHHYFHTLLTRLIPLLGKHFHERRAPGTAAKRNDAHGIISYLYWHYRESKGAKLHPDLMLVWLKHLTKRMDSTHREQRSERNVTANMVIADWQRWHAQLSIEAVHCLMEYSANAGAVDTLGLWTAYLARRFPAYQEQRKMFWAQIQVHASLSDLPAAKKAFDDVHRSTRAHGDRPDLKCWNVLLRAHQNAEDLQGAIETFKGLIQTTSLTPDVKSFSPIIVMLSRRGDVDGMEDFLQQYDTLTQEKRMTGFVNMQLRALTIIDDVPRAELLLEDTLRKVHRGEVLGTMTDCFNTLLFKYAAARDLDAVTITYRRMKERNIYRSEATYQHLMQALANFRRTSAAWTILKKVMKDDGFEPTAVHYTVVMSGFCNQGEPDKAIMAHDHMLAKNIRQSVSTKANLAKASALIRKNAQNSLYGQSVEHSDPLTSALDDLRETVNSIQARDITNGTYAPQDTFSSVMWVLGKERRMDAVKQLFQDAKDLADKHGQSPWPTFRLSAALMNSMYHAKEYSQVEAHWRDVKSQADAVTPLKRIPDFVALRAESQNKTLPTPTPAQRSVRLDSDGRAEVGFVHSHHTTIAQSVSDRAESLPTHIGPRPAPARRHVLARPFRIYLASLAAQNRILDAIKEATRLLTQGYTFDQITWNRFIQYIAGSDPPLALLSFTLMERYLIPNFPGWVPRESSRKYRPRKSARAIGLQYIRARYLAQNELMPQYRTFIWLAKALLEVQRRESTGWKGDNAGHENDPTLQRFIGTVKQIREKAPRTWKYVQLMPRIDDKWQNRLLRGIGWKFLPDSDRPSVVGDATSEKPNVADAKLGDAQLDQEKANLQAAVSVDIDASFVEQDVPESRNEVSAPGSDVQSELDNIHESEYRTIGFADDVGNVIDSDPKVASEEKP